LIGCCLALVVGCARPLQDGDYVRLEVRPLGENRLTHFSEAFYDKEMGWTSFLGGPSRMAASPSNLDSQQADRLWELTIDVVEVVPEGTYLADVGDDELVVELRKYGRERTYFITDDDRQKETPKELLDLVAEIYKPIKLPKKK
jgi:hypothetical protein